VVLRQLEPLVLALQHLVLQTARASPSELVALELVRLVLAPLMLALCQLAQLKQVLLLLPGHVVPPLVRLQTADPRPLVRTCMEGSSCEHGVVLHMLDTDDRQSLLSSCRWSES